MVESLRRTATFNELHHLLQILTSQAKLDGLKPDGHVEDSTRKMHSQSQPLLISAEMLFTLRTKAVRIQTQQRVNREDERALHVYIATE